jgi:hypothetical protein
MQHDSFKDAWKLLQKLIQSLGDAKKIKNIYSTTRQHTWTSDIQVEYVQGHVSSTSNT